MAHSKYATRRDRIVPKHPLQMLSLDYRLARVKQLRAFGEKNLTEAEAKELRTFFDSLPRRVRRQLNQGKASL
jgi:hypothetical protein